MRALGIVGVLVVGFGVSGGYAQGLSMPAQTYGSEPAVEADALTATQAEQLRENRKTRRLLERELKKLRGTYFRSRNEEVRQAGISKLRQYSDPAIFPSLLEVFREDEEDVRSAIVEHLASLGTGEADATLAWAAVFDEDSSIRDLAAGALVERLGETGENARGVESVVSVGLRSGSEEKMNAAAALAVTLKMYEAIPALVAAQLPPPQRDTAGQGALAVILVGQQQRYVADLTPVIGDSAVAFDPTLDVITEGTYIRVIDAVVVTYQATVHRRMLELASEGVGGGRVDHLGYDSRAWRDWFLDELVPYQEAQGTPIDATAIPASWLDRSELPARRSRATRSSEGGCAGGLCGPTPPGSPRKPGG